MAISYTSVFALYSDLVLYVSLLEGKPLDLSILPSIAKVRYPWIVANWSSLYPAFKMSTGGDGNKESALADFDSSVKSYLLGNLTNVLENSSKFRLYSPFLQMIAIDSIGLTTPERQEVDQQTQRVGKFTIEDFRSMLAYLNNVAAVATGSIGLGDSDAYRALGTPTGARTQSPTIAALTNIDAIYQLSKYVESIIFGLKQTVNRPPNLLAVANANVAPGSEVSIQDIYKSYVAVPYTISLEHMALMFLGSVDRWYELATVNNLQPPYVDEMGQKFPLLAPGASNNVLVAADRARDVNVGTKVAIGSYKVKEEYRVVEKMIVNSDNSMVLFLSGLNDVSKLQTTEGAFVRIYSPHTVGSGSFILIPLTADSAITTANTPESDELRRLDKALLDFGVDIARTESGDMLIDNNGNFVMSYGLANVKQAVRSVLRTIRGELNFHEGYGLDMDIGGRFFGAVSKINLVIEGITKAVLSDPRFVSCTVRDITGTPSSMSITLMVQIAGSSQTLPLSFVA